MHRLRKALGKGEVPQLDPLLAEKGTRNQAHGKLAIPRKTSRQSNHRNEDRYHVADEFAQATWRNETHQVRMVNFSSNGVQIECERPASIGEVLAVKLGECGSIGCAVRWVRGSRIGLEFVDETQILSDAGVIDHVIEGIKSVLTASGEPVDRKVGIERRGQAMRHGMIWFGCVQCEGDTSPVRLRNISATGALVAMDSTIRIKRGQRLALDLGLAGEVSAEVIWAAGNELGLSFERDFDVSLLTELPAADVELLEAGEVHEPEDRATNPLPGDDSKPSGDCNPPENARLTIEELYATLYPQGRPVSGTCASPAEYAQALQGG